MTAPARFAGLRAIVFERHRTDALRAEREALDCVVSLLLGRMGRRPGAFVLGVLILAELDRAGFSVTRRGAA